MLTISCVKSTLSAAATLGAFSWPSTLHAPWQSSGLWYSSLLLAIFALITGAQHTALLETIIVCKNDCALNDMRMYLHFFLKPACKDLEADQSASPSISNNMVFIWQTPLMLMGWSWISFVLALTLHIVRPLCAALQNEDLRPVSLSHNGLAGPKYRALKSHTQAAIFYLSTCGTVCVAFIWCSFWAYRAASHINTTSKHVCVKVVALNCHKGINTMGSMESVATSKTSTDDRGSTDIDVDYHKVS